MRIINEISSSSREIYAPVPIKIKKIAEMKNEIGGGDGDEITLNHIFFTISYLLLIYIYIFYYGSWIRL